MSLRPAKRLWVSCGFLIAAISCGDPSTLPEVDDNEVDTPFADAPVVHTDPADPTGYTTPTSDGEHVQFIRSEEGSLAGFRKFSNDQPDEADLVLLNESGVVDLVVLRDNSRLDFGYASDGGVLVTLTLPDGSFQAQSFGGELSGTGGLSQDFSSEPDAAGLGATTGTTLATFHVRGPDPLQQVTGAVVSGRWGLHGTGSSFLARHIEGGIYQVRFPTEPIESSLAEATAVCNDLFHSFETYCATMERSAAGVLDFFQALTRWCRSLPAPPQVACLAAATLVKVPCNLQNVCQSINLYYRAVTSLDADLTVEGIVVCDRTWIAANGRFSPPFGASLPTIVAEVHKTSCRPHGDFALTSVDGRALPANLGDGYNVTGGAIQLRPDGTYTANVELVEIEDGSRVFDENTGSYVVDGNRLLFNPIGNSPNDLDEVFLECGSYTATTDGNTITVQASDCDGLGPWTLVYSVDDGS